MSTLELIFDNEKDKELFIGWFLDGGGEQLFDYNLPRNEYFKTDLNYKTRSQIRISWREHEPLAKEPKEEER